jgi:hypothetical protein
MNFSVPCPLSQVCSSLMGQHGDGMGLETTVDPALIRGLVTALP